jgi:hypothetical protein
MQFPRLPQNPISENKIKVQKRIAFGLSKKMQCSASCMGKHLKYIFLKII